MEHEQRISLAAVFQKWDATDYEEDPLVEHDWKKPVREKIREGAPLKEIRKAALPTIQYEMIRLAHEAESEKDRISAGTLILGQEGEGAVHKVEETHIYDRLPAEQLVAVIASKVEKLSKLIPGFSLEKFVDAQKLAQPIAVEFTSDNNDAQSNLPIHEDPEEI